MDISKASLSEIGSRETGPCGACDCEVWTRARRNELDTSVNERAFRSSDPFGGRGECAAARTGHTHNGETGAATLIIHLVSMIWRDLTFHCGSESLRGRAAHELDRDDVFGPRTFEEPSRG